MPTKEAKKNSKNELVATYAWKRLNSVLWVAVMQGIHIYKICPSCQLLYNLVEGVTIVMHATGVLIADAHQVAIAYLTHYYR